MSGVTVKTSQQLVTFLAHDERAQELIEEPAFQQWHLPDSTPWTLFYRRPTHYLLRFPGLGDFEVSQDGRAVQSWPAPGVPSPTVEHLYLNQVLPLALSRQGKLVLHASAVEVGNQCLVFLGESGRGKSTLAASFATSGARFLTDDGLHLEWVDSQLTAMPSHPSIRLWQDSQDALIGETDAMAPTLHFTTKARLLAGPALDFCDEAKPLAAIYFLGNGDARSPHITVMKPAAALMQLVRNSFLLDIDEQEMLAMHFSGLSKIANLPIHYHLDYPRQYEGLPLVREAVIRHASEGSS
ncbi:hypothetical protein [Ramlibacter sp. WS9]|uniref:hypothetical protein n=1 Tax=Ramlibacter sp. WS9 TaxID=1882741 RepID=UPI0011448DA6|nr:hypothetical protein [Ramlibacter sp. WS9]ROZ66374.1 hypothetical protein EEB15_26550 [Ramlibacter sp. WS9]